MDVMTALGKLASEFGADNSAAAVSWINRNSDVHKCFNLLSLKPCYEVLSG
jgi:hypothetical protein